VRHSLMQKIIISAVIALLAGISGCRGMLPPPAEVGTKFEFKGPYDVDIPEQYVIQLKQTGTLSAWARPHIFINVGMHFESLGDETRALHFFNRAENEFRILHNATGEGIVLNRKIFALAEFGRMQDAYNAIKEADKNWPQAPLQTFVYHNYGHYYLMSGDYNRALDYFRKSLQSNTDFRQDINLLMLRRDSELGCGIAAILADYFPAMYRKFNLLDFDETFYDSVRHNVDESISHLHQVVVLNDEIRKTKINNYTPEITFQIMESKVYNFLGLSYGIKGRFPAALKYMDTSAQLAGKAHFRNGEVDNLFFRSLVYLLQKNLDEGLKVSRQFNDIVDKYHLPFYQISAKFILSSYYRGYGDNLQAISLLGEAVKIMEEHRSEPVVEAFKDVSLFNQQMIYETLMELLAKEGDYKGAFEIAERAKAKELVDLLTGKDIGRTPVETELIKKDKYYVTEIADSYRKLLSISGRGDLALINALSKIEKKEALHSDVIFNIKRQNDELYSLLAVAPIDIEEVRRLLDRNTTLFSYYVSDKELYVWAVNKDRVHLERIKINREDISRIVLALNTAIASRNKKQSETISEKVYETFLKPVIPFVSGDCIGFIPHGPLHYLPFAAMSYKGQYLVDGFSIFYLPGAGLLKYEMKKQPSRGWKVLALGNPDLGNKQLDLPYAELEVENIRKLFPQTKILLRAEASKNKAMEMLGNYDIVHFATRGFLREDFPINSGLQLAAEGQSEGRLTTAEIFRLQFNGRLIVMSGCRVVQGIAMSGAEITGLNRAFLYAGSPSVIATLWNTEDKSTAVFMEIFYKNLKKNESIADSLKESQVEMIHRGYAPYYWAAFILTGIY
jgi:CHAT domain-containing protein